MSTALMPTVSASSLETYIQSVNRYPLLSLEEEQELARRWRDHEDVDAARKLVLSHLRVVVSTARHYMGYGLPQADLIQEGNIGLMKAVKRFDPDRGVRLVSFALHWIKAEIHEYILKNWRLVKVATTKAQRKLFFNLRSMKQGLGSLGPAETAAIARELNVKPEEVREMETRLSGQDIGLDPTVEDGEESYSPIAYLASPEDEPLEVLAREQNERLKHEGLSTALTSLDDRSRRIIEARWLSEDSSATLHELAAEFGISAERVRQIEAKAMKKMRELIPA
ncbi:RNA polymerase sigma factor RpoH [Betaproteobacteria bacterium SCN2]|jgi:RNA polymerase sigma-32 factor|nr:RNA polymerase sigma factor RpoH [Betaproteobacteria bacterium SCN2]